MDFSFKKRAGIYKSALEKILKEQRKASPGSRRLPDRETFHKLASLGYVGANVSKDGFSFDREPHFKVYEQLGEISMRESNIPQAIANYSRALEQQVLKQLRVLKKE